MEQDKSDAEFNAATSRLLRREALRRAAAELNTTSGPGLESMLERIANEVTADAAERLAEKRDAATLASPPAPPQSRPSKP
jgi:hypothetical protein